MAITDLQTFFDEHLTTALDLSQHPDAEDDTMLIETFDTHDFTLECRQTLSADCEKFFNSHKDMFIPESVKIDDLPVHYQNLVAQKGILALAGSCFWAERNNLGGFSDHWKEPHATMLATAARAFGEFQLFVTDAEEIDGELSG
jgi:hypothetical protein